MDETQKSSPEQQGPEARSYFPGKAPSENVFDTEAETVNAGTEFIRDVAQQQSGRAYGEMVCLVKTEAAAEMHTQKTKGVLQRRSAVKRVKSLIQGSSSWSLSSFLGQLSGFFSTPDLP